MKYTKLTFCGLLALCLSVQTALASSGNALEKYYGVKGPTLSQTAKGKSHSYTVKGTTYKTLTHEAAKAYSVTGIASFYAKKFNGRKTASGEIYNENLLTAAHKHLPIPSYVLVTNIQNGRKVVVRINDRGPFIGDRKIDLSKAAARELGMLNRGTAKVKLDIVHVDRHGNISGPGGEKLLTIAKQKNLPLPGQKDAQNAVEIAQTKKQSAVKTAQNAPQNVSVSAHTYELQSVNLKSDQQAKALIAKLTMDNIDSEIIREGDHYKVKFGPIANRTMVNQLKSQLVKEGHRDNILYSYNAK
ncbi:septal ring lytic transglycosylase RlpA family protein [Spirabiliibacterium falconis]|uniref:septal ring lytic transglycosylase RlpA family protein n=1 Tax=Spirabiliibacterium falconis TaxID=572023 RepID=UPI001AAE0892|nr:septal ring lytic transglycosylase RlpA family protein [Spirabiliibacterium falconis]MBE2895218.1 septal ring lytic transglycosylase RlpA family protein [Spirabiliibacterium falconis]